MHITTCSTEFRPIRSALRLSNSVIPSTTRAPPSRSFHPVTPTWLPMVFTIASSGKSTSSPSAFFSEMRTPPGRAKRFVAAASYLDTGTGSNSSVVRQNHRYASMTRMNQVR